MSGSSEATGFSRLALGLASLAAGVAAQGCAATAYNQGVASGGAAPVEFRSGDHFYKPSLNEDGAFNSATDGWNANLTASASDPGEGYLSVGSNVGVQPSERGDGVIVQKGDTLYAISRRYRVSLDALIATNNAAPPYTIEIGQTVWLPPANVHIVGDGETLQDISDRFNVDYRSLAVMNNLPKPYDVAPGDQIRLPGLARDFGAFHIASSELDKGDDIVSKSSPDERVFSDQAVLSDPRPATPNAPAPVEKPARRTGQVSAQGFAWPLDGDLIRGFGDMPGGAKNEGLNIAAPAGAPVYAAAAGHVVYAGADVKEFGNLLLIAHDGDMVSAYAHVSGFLAAVGDKVVAGQPIAAVGESGAVGDPQLHFQIRRQKTPVDPTTLLPPRAGS